MANSSIIEKAKNFVAKNKGKLAALAALGAVGAAGAYAYNKGYFNQSADVNAGSGPSTGSKVPGGSDVRKVNDRFNWKQQRCA